MLSFIPSYSGGRTPREILLDQDSGQNSVIARIGEVPCDLSTPAEIAAKMLSGDVHIGHNLVTIQVVDATEASVYFELTGKVLPPRQYSTSQQ